MQISPISDICANIFDLNRACIFPPVPEPLNATASYPRIMTMSTADKAAWKEMLASSRGNHRLTTALQTDFGVYFIAKGTPLGEIGTSPPSGAGRALEQYVAGITDDADIGNFGRFMENEPTTGAGSGSLGPSRIADALVAPGRWHVRSERYEVDARISLYRSADR